jgi:putative membrane protein
MTHPPERLDVDVRFLLANERTLLAWLRTSLTMLAGGVALVHLSEGRMSLMVAAIGILGLGMVCAIIGYVRYRAAGRAIRAGALPASGYGAATITVGVVLFAAVVVAIYIADSARRGR